MKIATLNTRFCMRFCLICLSCPFQNLSYMSKNIPFIPILHVFAPLNDVRAYIAWSWKNNPNYVNFFTRMISNFKNKWPPRALCPPDPPVATPLPILTVHTQFGNVRNGFHLISLYPQNSWGEKKKKHGTLVKKNKKYLDPNGTKIFNPTRPENILKKCVAIPDRFWSGPVRRNSGFQVAPQISNLNILWVNQEHFTKD